MTALTAMSDIFLYDAIFKLNAKTMTEIKEGTPAFLKVLCQHLHPSPLTSCPRNSTLVSSIVTQFWPPLLSGFTKTNGYFSLITLSLLVLKGI